MKEAGDILSVSKRLPAQIVQFICAQVAEFKKLNQETEGAQQHYGSSTAMQEFAEDEQQISDIDDGDEMDSIDD